MGTEGQKWLLTRPGDKPSGRYARPEPATKTRARASGLLRDAAVGGELRPAAPAAFPPGAHRSPQAPPPAAQLSLRAPAHSLHRAGLPAPPPPPEQLCDGELNPRMRKRQDL